MKTAFIKRFSLLVLLVCALACCAAALYADIYVDTEAGLQALGNQSISQDVWIVGKTYDMTGKSWTPIKKLAAGKRIIGNGAVIVGLDLAAVVSSNYSGFVGENQGMIENLSIRTSANVSVTKTMGGIAAYNGADGTISNCIVYADTEGSVTVTVNSNTSAGGIAGKNEGVIEDCMVKNLAFSSAGKAQVGGIAGHNYGAGAAIERCYAYYVSIANTGGGDTGYYGFITGKNEQGTVYVANADNCSLSSDKSYIGGVAGYVDYDSGISDCWVKNCDITLTDTGAMGGIVGFVYTDGGTNISRCYAAGKKSSGLVNSGSGKAGGVAGILDTDNPYDEFLTRCYYETDNVSGITQVAGGFEENAGIGNMASCAGVDTQTMQGPDWAADNLSSDWIRDADLYPVYNDGNIRLISISRPSQGGVALNRNIYRVCVGDLMDIGYVNANTVIYPQDFSLEDLIGDDTDITADYFTVNGIRITGPVTAGDYTTLDFSAKVTNNTAVSLQNKVDYYTGIYNRGRRMYTAASLATMKAAIDAASAVLADHFINVTKTEADPLAAAMDAAVLDKLMCTVTFSADHGSVQYGGEAAASVKAEINTAVALTAVPDNGYEFVYWKDSAGNILGESAALTYTVFGTTTLTAEFRPAGKTFTYQDNYGKIYKIQQATDYSQVSYPVAAGDEGLRTGFTVESWTNDYPGELPASGAVTGDVVFTANLVRIATDEFTVKYRPNPNAEWVEGTYKLAYVFEATAEDSYGGADFSCWKDGDGNVVSYDKTLSVSVYADSEFTAYYDGAAAGVTIANLQGAAANSDTGKIAFTGQVLFGDDFSSEVYHGVLMLKSSTAVADLDFNTPNVIVGKSTGYSALTNTFIINKKNVAAGETWYGRAFIVYYDANNEMQIAFSDVKSATM